MFLNPKDYEKTMAVKPVKEKTLQEIYDKTIRTLWSYRMPVVRIDYPVSTPAEPKPPEVNPVWFNSDGRVGPALMMLEHEDVRLLRKTVGYDMLQTGFLKEDESNEDWPSLIVDRETILAMFFKLRGDFLQEGSYYSDILAAYGPAYVSAINLYLGALANRGVVDDRQIRLIFELEQRHFDWFNEYENHEFLTQIKTDIPAYSEWRRFHRSFIGIADGWSLSEKVLLSIADGP